MKYIKLIKSKQYIAYHGTNSNFDTFDYSFLGKGNDEHGPGFYFTNKPEYAEAYGNVKKCNITINNPLSKSKSGNKDELIKMLCLCFDVNSLNELYNKFEDEDVFYDSTLSDLGENIQAAIDNLYKNYSNQSNYDMFMSLWGDIYRFDNKKFLEDILKLGYDGYIYSQNDSINYVVYDPKKIKSL